MAPLIVTTDIDSAVVTDWLKHATQFKIIAPGMRYCWGRAVFCILSYVINDARFEYTYTLSHTCHFNGLSPGKPSLADSPLFLSLHWYLSWASSRDKPKLSICTLTLSQQVCFRHLPILFPQSPSSYIAWPSLHHLYVQHIQATVILIAELTGSSPNDSLSSVFFFFFFQIKTTHPPEHTKVLALTVFFFHYYFALLFPESRLVYS